MERTHDEISELLGVYALDAVDDEEREAVERHLATCPRCAAEVSEHREVAATMAYTGAPAPEGLWTKIAESLEESPPAMNLALTPSAAPEDAPVVDLSARRERRNWLPMGAVAAALVVVALIAGVLIGNATGSDGQPAQQGSDLALEDVARRVMNDPDAARVTLESPEGETMSATAAVDPDGSGYLVGSSLPALDDSQTYQLWGVHGDVVVSLGVLGSSPDVVAFHLDEAITTLVVTAEVAGGVPQSSNPALLVGDVS